MTLTSSLRLCWKHRTRRRMKVVPSLTGNLVKVGRRSRSSSRGRDRRRSRSRSKDRHHHRSSRSRDVRYRSRSRDRRYRSRDRRRSGSRSRDRRHSGSRSRDHRPSISQSIDHRPSRSQSSDHRREHIRYKSPVRKSTLSRSRSPFFKEKSPVRAPIDNLSPEERDARTVFCMQLAARIRSRDLEDFFSSVGKVRDVRIISDRNSRRSKGIAYIEFCEAESVPLAIGLTGQRLLGVPIIVQASQAEKNRIAAMANNLQKGILGPMRLYVGSLHFNITEDMLRGIFEPFGKIENIQLMKDLDTGRSKGYGFISFADADCARRALEQLNGFELAGRPIKVGHVTERMDGNCDVSFLDSDELERTGVDLGTTGRLQLMAKLAEGTGIQIPPAAQAALQLNGAIPLGALNPILGLNQSMALTAPIATQCFQLSNMFNPQTDTDPNLEVEITEDVVEECNKHGGVVHVFVDRNSPTGNVYVKCPTIAAAMAAVNALHGRWFAGKMITAAYIPLASYHDLFPESMNASQLISSAKK
ncbi:RNA-binding protein 39-like isoform X2 [Protopterus annectens]|uniref:RNA-binding protein 39-like isoform X2 n=2 Tax=Protopterus annectens TaxID=7888 RepID=UPI001CFA1C6A|nr:RNA-binding protein 39-like isoform X2 [Protopterus annectens]